MFNLTGFCLVVLRYIVGWSGLILYFDTKIVIFMQKSLVSYRQHPFWKTSDKESGDWTPGWKIFPNIWIKKCPNVELFRCCIFWYIFYLTMIRHIVVYALRDPEIVFYLPPKFDKILSSKNKFYRINIHGQNWPLGK